jgi:thiol-disulfide isomerase/thioredoxin
MSVSPGRQVAVAIVLIAAIAAVLAAIVYVAELLSGGPEEAAQPQEAGEMPNGVYVWNGTSFEPLNVSGSVFVPQGDGVYVLYFHNNQCPVCRRFEPVLVEALRSEGVGAGRFYMVVSDWFWEKYTDSVVAETFKFFNISKSPTVLLVEVREGKVVRAEDLAERLAASGKSVTLELLAQEAARAASAGA